MKFKHILLGIMVIVTLASVNAYGTAFAGDSLNSINPNYQNDQSSSSSSDNTGSSDQQPQSSSSDSSTQTPPDNSLAKTAVKAGCSAVMGHLGSQVAPLGAFAGPLGVLAAGAAGAAIASSAC